jgi:hypothetical protein
VERIVSISVWFQTIRASIGTYAPARCGKTKTVLIPGATFGKVSHAAHHSVVARPSHSDDPCNTLEPIGLDTTSLVNTCDKTPMTP